MPERRLVLKGGAKVHIGPASTRHRLQECLFASYVRMYDSFTLSCCFYQDTLFSVEFKTKCIDIVAILQSFLRQADSANCSTIAHESTMFF